MKRLFVLFLVLAESGLTACNKTTLPTSEAKATQAPVRLICTEKYRDFRRALIETEIALRIVPPSDLDSLRVYKRHLRSVLDRLETEQKMAFGSLDVDRVPDEKFIPMRRELLLFEISVERASVYPVDLEAFGKMREQWPKALAALAAITACP
ncbi:MAG: hypothetical protein ACHQPI_01555 [Thermoanaerobaculia bacterium]